MVVQRKYYAPTKRHRSYTTFSTFVVDSNFYPFQTSIGFFFEFKNYFISRKYFCCILGNVIVLFLTCLRVSHCDDFIRNPGGISTKFNGCFINCTSRSRKPITSFDHGLETLVTEDPYNFRARGSSDIALLHLPPLL